MASQVTVIIPTFNRADWLEETLACVAIQTFANLEVVVIDDGSQDHTPEILEQIRKNFTPCRFTTMRTEGLGVSAARNLGIRSSSSPYLAFLDSDDRWQPEKLEKQVRALEGDSQAALCHTDEIWMRRGKRVNACLHHRKSGGWIFPLCLPRCVISPSATLIRRTVLNTVGFFDESLPVCEDYDLWLRITCRYPVTYLEEPLTTKNGGHVDQLSRRLPIMDRYRIQALVKILETGTLCDADRQLAQETLREKVAIVRAGATKRGNHRIENELEQIGRWL